MNFTPEQQKAYRRFITARDKVGLVRTSDFTKTKWVPFSDVVCTVDVAGFNHPFFEPNHDWAEYLEASRAWRLVEPESRKDERMSAIRGDYGTADSWDEGSPRVRDVVSLIGDE
jgi:hypothetical protein